MRRLAAAAALLALAAPLAAQETPVFSRPAAPAPDAAVGRVVSWNVQTFGRSVAPRRREALRLALARLLPRLGPGPVVLAAQEVANDAGSRALERMLPEGWAVSFEDSRAAMNNGLYAGPGVRINCGANVEIPGVGHPPRMAHVTVGGADFTLLSVHLAFSGGDARASAADLDAILDWVRAEAARPGADPDFVIAGDFNLPTRRGKAGSARARERRWSPLEDVADDFVALVDERTSRNRRGEEANNYDHFLVSPDFAAEELIDAGMLDAAAVREAEAAAGSRSSDHFPIALAFRHSGAGADGRPIELDGDAICR